MTGSEKNLSNPFSTGGGGSAFESRVQAAFVVLLLTGRSAPCVGPWPITRLKLQGRYAGFHTDDFIAFTTHPQSGREAKLLAQIKHEVSITKTDKTFTEVIQAAWNDFNGEYFDSSVDAFALITGPLSAADTGSVRPILEWARTSADEAEFLNKVNASGFSSKEKRVKLDVFKTQLAKANNETEVSDRRLWRFLKAFHLVGYDLDIESGSTSSLLQSLIAQYANGSASLLWSKILEAVQSANQSAGTITWETVPGEIRNAFDTVEDPIWEADVRKLRAHGNLILDVIRTDVGGVHIKFSEEFARLLEKSESHRFVYISGERGSGKSSLARRYADYLGDQAPAFCLRAEDLDKPHLSNVFTSIGLVHSLDVLETHFALMPKKILLIESLEKFLEIENKAAFLQLLHYVSKDKGWTIIATGRDYAYQQIAFNFLQPTGIAYSSLRLDGFSDEQVRHLCSELPPLDTFANNPSLRPLLSSPYFAKLAFRVASTGTRFSSEEGEKEFQAAVWGDVIADDSARANGMPSRRIRTFVDIAVSRAKRMAYGIPDTGFDAEALHKLEEDHLLQCDRSDGALRLVSPAHDVLEDWALDRYIEEAYLTHRFEVPRLLDEIGHEPAMHRAFRLWLHRKQRFGENLSGLVLAILGSHVVQSYWKNETITAVLLGSDSLEFLNALRDRLFESEGELLKRFCFVLRVACKTPDYALADLLAGGENTTVPKPLFLKPFGNGWEAIIRFLYENKERISAELVSHVAAVLEEWKALFQAGMAPPAPAHEAGLLALHLLEPLKDVYRDDGTRKVLLSIVVYCAPAINEEFSDLLEADVFSTNDDRERLSYVPELCELTLKGVETAYLCLFMPNTVIRLAFHEWFIGEPEMGQPESWYVGHKDVEECFGLHEHRYRLFPASGRKGPFEQLLRFHPRKGLDFILQLLNHSAEEYANSDLDSPQRYSSVPIETSTATTDKVEITLADGTLVDQYWHGRLWGAYREQSVVPNLLQSALMALENWLVDLAELPESEENLQWVFDYILRNSNSVMPTAVLASVATGFPLKVGRAAFPLLRTPVLYDLDRWRFINERGGNELNWFAMGLRREPGASIYAAERRKAALRPWRKEHLEGLIVRLQLSGLREETLAVLDDLRSAAPESESWRFCFHRIDSRTWKAVEDSENNRVLFQPKSLEPDLEQSQREAQADLKLSNRFSSLHLWSNQRLRRESLDQEYYSTWREALTEAKALHEMLSAGTPAEMAFSNYGNIVKAAAVLLRDYSTELSREDKAWCAELVSQAVAADPDTDDRTAAVDATDQSGAAASASVLPILLDLDVSDANRLTVKRLIATALTHVNENVRTEAANGVREHLWQRDFQFAQRCLAGSLEYARFQQENRDYYRVSGPLSGGADQDKVTTLATLKQTFRESLAQGELPAEVGEIGFDTHDAQHILQPCLMIPNGSTDSAHVSFFSAVLALLVDPQETEDDTAIYIRHELSHKIAGRFAEYLLSISEADMNVFVGQLRDGCDTAPGFVNYLLLSIAVQTEMTQDKERYWKVWSRLSEKVQSIAIELATSDHRSRQQDDKCKLVRSMLGVDVEWQKVDYERQDIALGKDFILEFATNAGGNPDVFEAMGSLMYHFPSIFFESGIHILARHLKETNRPNLLSGTNTKFYLERSIHRFLLMDETGPLSHSMHRSCHALLDAIVASGSSRAYLLLEDLIHSRRIR